MDKIILDVDNLDIQGYLDGTNRYIQDKHVAYLFSIKTSFFNDLVYKLFNVSLSSNEEKYVSDEMLLLKNNSDTNYKIINNFRLVQLANNMGFIEVNPKNRHFIRVSSKGEDFKSLSSLIENLLNKYKLVWTIVIIPFAVGILGSFYFKELVFEIVKYF